MLQDSGGTEYFASQVFEEEVEYSASEVEEKIIKHKFKENGKGI